MTVSRPQYSPSVVGQVRLSSITHCEPFDAIDALSVVSSDQVMLAVAPGGTLAVVATVARSRSAACPGKTSGVVSREVAPPDPAST